MNLFRHHKRSLCESRFRDPTGRQCEVTTRDSFVRYHDLLIVAEAARGWPVPLIEDLLKRYSPGTPSRRMSAREVTKQYPDLRYRNITAGLVDTSGVILLAAKILRILRVKETFDGGSFSRFPLCIRVYTYSASRKTSRSLHRHV